MITALVCLVVNPYDQLLEKLPSPALVEDLVKLKDAKHYRLAMEQTDEILTSYAHLTDEAKAASLKEWWRRIESRHRSFEKSVPVEKSKWRSYLINSSMNETDLTKIDLILLAQCKEPMFHTSQWIYQLYGIDAYKPFEVPIKGILVPDMFDGIQAISWERGAPSFDHFFRDETKAVVSWILSDCRANRPEPMNPQKMYKKGVG